MKVAVLLGGQPRFSEEFDWFLRNLKGADTVDYFCHLWQKSDELHEVQNSAGNVLVAPNWQNVDESWARNKFKECLPENHNLVSLVLEDQENLVKEKLTVNAPWEVRQPNMWKMLYTLHMANKNKIAYEEANNFKYDLVIRHRPDQALMHELDLRDILEKINSRNNLVIIPTNSRCGYGVYISDMFAVSSSKNMDIYCNLYNEVLDHHSRGSPFHPETMLAHHLSHHLLVYEPGPFNIEVRYFGTWTDVNTGQTWSQNDRYQINYWYDKVYKSNFGRWA